MEKLTIYDIKERTKETAPYFFTRKSMKFFNQTLKDFSVTRVDDTHYLLVAPSYWDGKLMGHTQRIFNTENNELEFVKEGD